MFIPLFLIVYIVFGFVLSRLKKGNIVSELFRAAIAFVLAELILKVYGCGYRTLFNFYIKEYKYEAYFVWVLMLIEVLVCFCDRATIQAFQNKYIPSLTDTK